MKGELRQDLSALFGSVGSPGLSEVVFVGCAECAALAYPLATEASYGGAVLAAFVFCVAVLFFAYSLGAGAVTFTAEAKRSCLPGSQRLKRRGIFIASLLLLAIAVIPAVAIARSTTWEAWIPTALVLVIALAGVVIPFLSTDTVGVLLLVALTGYWVVRGLGGRERNMELFFALLSAVLALAPVAKWRRFIREGPRSRSVFGLLQPLSVVANRRRIRIRESGNAAAYVRFQGRPSPVTVIRTSLGGLFAQQPVRNTILEVLVLIVLVAAVVVIGGLLFGGSGNARRTIMLEAILAAGLVHGFLERISKLTREGITELALLPGLGDGIAQRRALCWAVLALPIPWLAGILLLASGSLLLKRAPFSSIGTLGIDILVIWLTYAALALVKLVSFLPRHRNRVFGIPERLTGIHTGIREIMPVYLAVYFCAIYDKIYAVLPFTHVDFVFWAFWAIPVLFGIALASATGYAVHRLTSAPHPFLS